MAVKLKEEKVNEKDLIKLDFKDIKSYMAIEGLKGSLFEGQTKVVHKHLGESLIKRKLAKESKAEIEVEENLNRTVKPVKK